MGNFFKTLGYTLIGAGAAYLVHRYPWLGTAMTGGGIIVAGHLPGWDLETNKPLIPPGSSFDLGVKK